MEWVLFGLLLVAGYVLGVVGFFQARAARREVALLRAMVLSGTAPAQGVQARLDEVMPEAPAAPPPFAPPFLAPPPPFSPPEAAPVAADAPQPLPDPAPPARTGLDWELLLTQRLGVWLGAAALLLAGVFLVRTAVEAGLLGPGPRCAMAALLGAALLAGAEWLRRKPAVPVPGLADYGPAALAAGAVGAWFAGAYGAGPLYGLVSATAGFILLAAAGVAGLLLSLRFGPLVAGVGLAASFATPLLVPTENPSTPGLFAYLLVTSAVAWGVVRYTAWAWLGWTAGVAGAAWVLLAAGTGEAWPGALFVPAAAALSVFMLPGAALDTPTGRRLSWAPFLLLGVAGLVLAGSEPGADTRAGVLLLTPVALGAAWLEPRLARLPWLSAGLFLLLLLVWSVPSFQVGEVVSIEGAVQAVLPTAWLPEAVQPFLLTGALMAALYAGAGLLLERRSPRPLPGAALVAAVPVLAAAVLYAQLGRLQSDAAWAAVALALAVGLVGAAGLARREGSVQRAGVHAAGAVAALALGCAILLTGQWLTLAVAFLLPPLALIAERAGLPPLRRVALVVALVVLVRLVLNPYVLAYDVGPAPVFNALLLAYGGPALCFAGAAALFRRQANDALVAVLAGGACLFTALGAVLQVRHGFNGGNLYADPGFGEFATQVCVLAGCAVAFGALSVRLGLPVLRWAGHGAGGLALVGGAGMILFNPAFAEWPVGARPFWNALLPAYAVPAALAVLALRLGMAGARVLPAYALLAAFTYVTLMVRQQFHPDMLYSYEDPGEAELWAYSGAWLALGAALLAAGWRTGQRGLRLAALALVGLAAAKVFLVDMAGLDGLWRVLSFLGLGLSLIGLGAFYRRMLARP